MEMWMLILQSMARYSDVIPMHIQQSPNFMTDACSKINLLILFCVDYQNFNN